MDKHVCGCVLKLNSARMLEHENTITLHAVPIARIHITVPTFGMVLHRRIDLETTLWPRVRMFRGLERGWISCAWVLVQSDSAFMHENPFVNSIPWMYSQIEVIYRYVAIGFSKFFSAYYIQDVGQQFSASNIMYLCIQDVYFWIQNVHLWIQNVHLWIQDVHIWIQDVYSWIDDAFRIHVRCPYGSTRFYRKSWKKPILNWNKQNKIELNWIQYQFWLLWLLNIVSCSAVELISVSCSAGLVPKPESKMAEEGEHEEGSRSPRPQRPTSDVQWRSDPGGGTSEEGGGKIGKEKKERRRETGKDADQEEN